MTFPISPRKKVDIMRDPIYDYIYFTVPQKTGEVAEKDIIDSEYFQRLRRIYQLPSAKMVYPGADHTRFQHSVGVMHLCSQFARTLFTPEYKHSVEESGVSLPSIYQIEEEIRLAGLLHDVGHGPFGHLLDSCFLSQFGLTHEDISLILIDEKFKPIIEKIDRSPYGNVEGNIDAENVKKWIKTDENKLDYWEKALYRILHGLWNADVIDFLLRDSYFCGTKEYGVVDWRRLIESSMIYKGGMALYETSLPALKAYILSRIFMFSSVYYHRTAIAFEISVRELLPRSMELLDIGDPSKEPESLEKYLNLSDMDFCHEVRKWAIETDTEKRKLGERWKRILDRKIEWRAIKTKKEYIYHLLGTKLITPKIKEEIKEEIAKKLSGIINPDDIVVDMPILDVAPPQNPFAQRGDKQDYAVYDPLEDSIVDHKGGLRDMIKEFPLEIVFCSLFVKKEGLKHKEKIRRIFDKVLEEYSPTQLTTF